MKRILFALSILLVLGISTDALSQRAQAPPKTIKNIAEVEILIEKKATEIRDKTRAEIQEQEDRLWNKVGIELDQSREELEDARAMVSRELENARVQLEKTRATFSNWLTVVSILVGIAGGFGIGAPMIVSRNLRNRLDKEVNEVERVKDEAERIKKEAEEILGKIKTVHSDAEECGDSIREIAGEVSSSQSLMPDQERPVNEIALGDDASSEERLRVKALKAQEEGRLGDAIGLWKALDILEPKNVYTLFNIAHLLQEMGYHSEAADRYEELNRRDLGENEAVVLNNWGNALFEQAESHGGEVAYSLYEEAKEKYQNVLDINRNDSKALFNCGVAFSKQAIISEGEKADRLYEKAYEKYEKAIEIEPNYHEVFNNWGITLRKQAGVKKGREADRLYEEAYAKYKKAINIKPDKYEAFNNWGTALHSQADTKKGKEAGRLIKEAGEKYLRADNIKEQNK